MSDIFPSFFHLVHESYLTDCFGEDVSELLAEKKIPLRASDIERPDGGQWYQCTHKHHADLPSYMRMDIFTRNGNFHWLLEAILSKSGIEGLRFLTGETCTHYQHDAYDYWTVLNPYYDEVLSSIDKVRQWCLANPDVVVELAGEGEAPQDVADLAGWAFVTLQPNEDGFDDGEGLACMLCVLKTIEDLLHRAKFFNKYRRRGQNEFWLVYQNSFGDFMDNPPKLVSSIH